MGRETAKGTSFETLVVNYLESRLNAGIERRAKFGTKDRGDIGGVYLAGEPVAIECKTHKRMELAEWLKEAEAERVNAKAAYGVVVHKRRGCGEKNAGGNYATMTLATLADILENTRR